MNALIAAPRAELDLGFVRRGGRTILDRRIFSWPFVLTRTFHLDPVPAHMLTVILQTSSGAIHGEDRLLQRFALAEGSAAHLTTQGAAAVHRAGPGAIADELVEMKVAEGAFLEYLPEPRILFPGSALRQTLDIACAHRATAIVSDAFTFHDPDGRDGMFRQLDSTMRIRTIEGEPLFVDRLNLTRQMQGVLAQYNSFGTIVMVVARSARILQVQSLELSRVVATIPGLYAAASLLPGDAGIGVRLAGKDMRALRDGLQLAWVNFRESLCGEAPVTRRKG